MIGPLEKNTDRYYQYSSDTLTTADDKQLPTTSVISDSVPSTFKSRRVPITVRDRVKSPPDYVAGPVSDGGRFFSRCF
jgi:hypothetical protein